MLHFEFSSSCRMKNHSHCRSSILTWPRQLTEFWMRFKYAYQRLLECWWRSHFVRFVDKIDEVHIVNWETSQDLCAPWSARGKSKQQPDWIICPLACGKSKKSKKSKTGLLRRQSSTLLENLEESNSSICLTKNPKGPLTTTSDALQDGDKKAL